MGYLTPPRPRYVYQTLDLTGHDWVIWLFFVCFMILCWVVCVVFIGMLKWAGGAAPTTRVFVGCLHSVKWSRRHIIVYI